MPAHYERISAKHWYFVVLKMSKDYWRKGFLFEGKAFPINPKWLNLLHKTRAVTAVWRPVDTILQSGYLETCFIRGTANEYLLNSCSTFPGVSIGGQRDPTPISRNEVKGPKNYGGWLWRFCPSLLSWPWSNFSSLGELQYITVCASWNV